MAARLPIPVLLVKFAADFHYHPAFPGNRRKFAADDRIGQVNALTMS
jgi:hypothetical protein